jgi:S1-C subfamily serine protease
MRKLAYIFGIALFLVGCAHAIDIKYDSATTQPFEALPLKGVKIYLAPIEDNRPNRDSKNLKQLSFGSATHFYYPAEPSVDLFRKALAVKLRNYGITITEYAADASHGTLKGVLKVFDFETGGLVGLMNATASIDLKLTSSKGKDILWNQNLRGEARGGLLDILSKALTRAINSLDSYPEFIPTVSDLSPVQNVDNSQQQQTQIPQKQVATLKAGTGVMLGEAGYVLTSYSLVRGMKQIPVKFVNGEKIDAPLFIKDEVNDIAFLKLNQSPNISLMNIAMGDSSQMQIGNKVFTIGYPISNILGQKPKYSEGVINSLSGIKDNLGFFQVSVPIQSGNSGGPLFNQHGELVAMVSSSLDPENTFRVLGTMPQNVNFAVKSSLVKNMIPMLPETLAAPTGIVVVPTDTDSLQSFIKRVQNNIVLIEAKE